jgi:hypothetical protein
VTVHREDKSEFTFTARCRIDTYNELEYFRAGGILPYVLRRQARDRQRASPPRRPVHRKRRLALDADRPPQAVDRQPLDQVVGRRFAIEQQSSPSAQTRKSNRHLPCGVSSPAQTGSGRRRRW